MGNMTEAVPKDQLEREIERGRFSEAASLPVVQGLPETEIEDLRAKALWQMAAVYRNGPGTESLAQGYGISKDELRDLLERLAKEKARAGDTKPLEPCYDLSARAHLSFEEWLEQLMKRW
jgi:hypothetical protein